MSADRTTRRVYSAEELHRLRSTCSQPKLSEAVESNDGDDAELVKEPESPTEHVLRGSRSFAARSFRSRASGNSLRVPSANKENYSSQKIESSRQVQEPQAQTAGTVLGEIPVNGHLLRGGLQAIRPSPTPSLKKKKAEAIVKAHGSPQHVRITAGGRIVPSEQSPLCHPRYGYSAIKTNGGLIKFAPNHPMGKAQWTQATQNGFVAQDVNGRLCQIVNGTVLPLNEVDGALRLYMPAPNLNVSGPDPSYGRSAYECNIAEEQQRAPLGKALPPPEPSTATQLKALEQESRKLESELKELEKTEVLHSRMIGTVAREALFGKRRELVLTLDKVRKAIRGITSDPPVDAPKSPRAMRDHPSTSVPRNRLPAFLQGRMKHNEAPVNHGDATAYPPLIVPSQYRPFFDGHPGSFGFAQDHHAGATPAMPLYDMNTPAVFVPPPSFEGSMPPLPHYQGSLATNLIQTGGHSAQIVDPQEQRNPGIGSSQTDGAGPPADHQSRVLSHALKIKVPSSKHAMGAKSTLNPMSPAYKPAHTDTADAENMPSGPVKNGVAPAILSTMQSGRPSAGVSKANSSTNETISPTKKGTHMHSSSTSSFETADFFPRNTREYSTRKYAYTDTLEMSEDKENLSPPHGKTSIHELSSSAVFGDGAPAKAPEPSENDDACEKRPDMPASAVFESTIHDHTSQELSDSSNVVPNRRTHNLSPKSKRQDLLSVQEAPIQSPGANIDFSNASLEWIQGYRAGLARRPVGSDHNGEFLDGYCAGLLKSKTSTATNSNIASTTGSPVKPIARRLSPATAKSAPIQDQDSNLQPLEIDVRSAEDFKRAVFAPHNEDAIVTPIADGPHANDVAFNLGVWEHHHSAAEHVAAYEFNAAKECAQINVDAIPDQQMQMSENDVSAQRHEATVRKDIWSGEKSTVAGEQSDRTDSSNTQDLRSLQSSDMSIRSSSLTPSSVPSNLMSSMTSIDANVHRQVSGHHILGPHLEWKSATSVAHVAGLPPGWFASKQHDEFIAANSARRVTSSPDKTSAPHMGRFREGSLDGITNPPNSPRHNSPSRSPSQPAKALKTSKGSPNKGSSPTKAKFEHIAEKVGIKVSCTGNSRADDGTPPSSPQSKRRWRDVWRTSTRKDNDDES